MDTGPIMAFLKEAFKKIWKVEWESTMQKRQSSLPKLKVKAKGEELLENLKDFTAVGT